MDPIQIVESTADAAFASDEEGRLVVWNEAAERLLGHKAHKVLGRPCHDVLCGLDVFGNRFCDKDCSLIKMVRRKEPIRRFEMNVRRSSGEYLRIAASILTVPGPKPGQFTVIHMLQPASSERDAASSGHVFIAGAEEPRPASAGKTPLSPSSTPLTKREIEVLHLLADGSSTPEIAESLFISVATVRSHIQNILRKLEVHSKLEAVVLGLRNRLI